MNPRKVPAVPPRLLFAIVVALRNLLVRLWRRLAPAEVVMFESMFQGLQTVHLARAACELVLEGLHLHQKLNRDREGGRTSYRA